MRKNINYRLTEAEKQSLKTRKVSQKMLSDYAPDEIAALLNASPERAKEIQALAEFQSIPSLGINFAEELIGQGYYSLEQLIGRPAVELFDAFEQHCGAWADPCVEDSYRLLVHYIENRDETKRWWHFTAERKAKLKIMLPIKPHLWFDSQAKEAAGFYTTLLPESAVTYVNQLHNTPTGDCDIVEFTLAGQPLMAISAGPLFKFNPSISFMVHFDTTEQLDQVWRQLADKYGLSWQLMLANPEGEKRPMIVPSLMFTEAMAGKANEAIDFYCSVFKEGKRGTTAPRPEDMGPDKAGTLMYADFYINGTWLAAMDSAHPHGFVFNEAVSLLISCESQEEIDYYFSALSADPKAEQCG